MANTGTKIGAEYLRMRMQETLRECSVLVSKEIDECYNRLDERPDEETTKDLDNTIDLHNQIGKYIKLLDIGELWQEQEAKNDKDCVIGELGLDEQPSGFSLAAYLAKNYKATDLKERIYTSLNALAGEARIGDWLALPDGTAYRCYFKPSNSK